MVHILQQFSESEIVLQRGGARSAAAAVLNRSPCFDPNLSYECCDSRRGGENWSSAKGADVEQARLPYTRRNDAYADDGAPIFCFADKQCSAGLRTQRTHSAGSSDDIKRSKLLPMTACKASLFISALVAILAHGADGNEFGDRLTSSPARPSRSAYSGPSGLAPDAFAEVDNGPDPFFRDLDVNVAQKEGPEFSDTPAKLRTFSVDVYELQSGGIGRRWRRIGWTYKVNSCVHSQVVSLSSSLLPCQPVCLSLCVCVCVVDPSRPDHSVNLGDDWVEERAMTLKRVQVCGSCAVRAVLQALRSPKRYSFISLPLGLARASNAGV